MSRFAPILLFLVAAGIFFSFNYSIETTAVAEIAPLQPEPVRVTYRPEMKHQLTLPDGQKKDVHSLLNIREKMAFGQYKWDDEGVPQGEVWVLVDLSRQIISVFRAGHEIGTAVILFGQDDFETPVGVFDIKAKIKDHESSIYEAKMPYTLRLTNDGVAIHSSSVRKGFATHGCIGIPDEFAALLFEQVHTKDIVAIVS